MPLIKPIPEAQERLDMIPLILRKHGIVFSKTQASKLVGGKARLRWLIAKGRISMHKPSASAQNGKWRCSAADVIKYMKL